MTYVDELPTAAIALYRKITVAKVLHTRMRASLRKVEIEFTISSQLQSSLREEAERHLLV